MLLKRVKSVEIWLLIMIGLVMAMIILGGATRLTNSGLSITEWAPIRGALPPLSAQDWLAEFEKYKRIPEFKAEHPDMDITGFKQIYFWEWSHRQLGRLIGLAYVIPLFIFYISHKLPVGKRRGFFLIALLIGLQGAVGWWMVHSGLQDNMVNVSQYRLAVHLGLAFLILGLLFWSYKRQRACWGQSLGGVGVKMAVILGVLVYVQILAGAFMAGTHAGRIYTTWPMMGGRFVPEDYMAQTPLWRNLFENLATIQFNHRVLAYLIFALTVFAAWALRRSLVVRGALALFGGLLICQIGLGVLTLLQAAPLRLALGHQLLAIFVFLASLNLIWKCRVAVK